MSILGKLEATLGLPSLSEVTELLEGDTGKRVNSILGRLEHLSKDASGIKDAVALLNLVKELDEKGTLGRLLELLHELSPLLKGKQAAALLERLAKLEGTLSGFLKE